jgi:hypothetical protein
MHFPNCLFLPFLFARLPSVTIAARSCCLPAFCRVLFGDPTQFGRDIRRIAKHPSLARIYLWPGNSYNSCAVFRRAAARTAVERLMINIKLEADTSEQAMKAREYCIHDLPG